jgi:hypothetical protein
LSKNGDTKLLAFHVKKRLCMSQFVVFNTRKVNSTFKVDIYAALLLCHSAVGGLKSSVDLLS